MRTEANDWFGCRVQKPVVIVGMGQLGTIFAEGFLKLGYPVVSVLRGQNMQETSVEPRLVVLAVGEDDLHAALASVPDEWKDRVVLLQNELRPEQWLSHQFYREQDPTVAIVWFEKKPGKLPHVVLPTVLYGPHSVLLEQTLVGLSLACRRIQSDEELIFELFLKNLYILGLNLGGIETGGSAGDLLSHPSDILQRVSADVLELERVSLKRVEPLGSRGAALSGIRPDEQALSEALSGAIAADPEHACSGRSAPRRLQRSLVLAEKLGIQLPAFIDLARVLQARGSQQ